MRRGSEKRERGEGGVRRGKEGLPTSTSAASCCTRHGYSHPYGGGRSTWEGRGTQLVWLGKRRRGRGRRERGGGRGGKPQNVGDGKPSYRYAVSQEVLRGQQGGVKGGLVQSIHVVFHDRDGVILQEIWHWMRMGRRRRRRRRRLGEK